MSQVRYRVAALTLGGLLLGLPLLTSGTASAEQIEAGDRQVVFDGNGMLGLSCRSAPDVSSMTVPAESKVRVVNRTGYPARLKLGNSLKGTLPDDGSAELVFRHGTTAVQLTPSCPFRTESTPLLVTATPEPTGPPPEDEPEPTSEQPTGGAVNTPPTTPSTTGGAPTSTGSTLPDTSAPTGRPTRTATSTATTTTRPGSPRPTDERTLTPATVVAVQTMPQGGAATTKVRAKALRGTDVTTPTFAGMPPGEQRAIVPGVPTIGLPTMSEAAALTPGVPPTDVAAAEPVAEMRPMPENRPVGLLAVVAGVCVLGVAVAAIRAFVSQRASRANIA
ncbi:hypothetical protein [Actinoplanes sp. NBRC 103695]|uniref:hypothetical protein n=1 Tax=Actinoplanes sp. NBRC 103695 TaxID=3032202 RepID=UPI0024A3CE4F|nr:hypothetical protein [Actinoplanes sp. NBRC 103695]GLZ01469.1 hypothetical protein Acsp02_87200 [Actinoplanes sp. NBRC 103695]